ncbi:MAG: hypothetical protein ACT4PE_16945 [Candidatus Eiseniibacteriota bacterium]
MGRRFAPRTSTLRRILLHRTRAARDLGLSVPRRLAGGPTQTLPQRIAVLDRWIAADLELAGGKRLPPWEPEDDDELDDDEPTLPCRFS